MKAIVLSVEKLQAKNNTEYLKLKFCDDKHVEKTAVMFSPFPSQETLKGAVCEVVLKPGTPTDKVESITIIPNADVSPFIRSSTFSADAMLSDVEALTRKAGDLTKIVDAVIFKHKARVDRLKTFPAARGAHHAFKGGLLEHTWGMMKVGEAILASDPAQRETKKHVVLCALALHDIGKIVTYDFEPGKSAEHNSFDHLLGHIVVADEMVVRACVELELKRTNDILNMRHCILSHHGRKEWGSPVFPATKEAVLVHQIDMLQSQGEMALEGIANIQDGKASETRHQQLNGVFLVNL